MRNCVRMMISISVVAGLASAALAGDDKAKPAPAPAAKPAPAPAARPAPAPAPPVKPGPGVKPAPVPPGKDAAKPAPPAPPAPPVMPTASPEVAAAVKAWTGTWKCNGQAFMPDGSAAPMKATLKTKFALDKFWAQTSFSELKKNGYKFESYRTFDGKKWHSVMVDNMGAQEVTWSEGPKEGKSTWEGSSRSFMGDTKVRHFEEAAGKEMKMWGEFSMDKGKTWTKGYEATCKR